MNRLEAYRKQKTRSDRRGDIDNELLKELYENKGYTVYRIAKETGWGDMTIRHRLKKMGVYRYKKGSE